MTPTRLAALSFAGTLALAAPVWAADPIGPLIEPDALAPLAEDWGAVIIDIRSMAAYAGGHVEGAVNVPYQAWRGPEENPGAPISDEKLTLILSEAGVEPGVPVVVTSAGEGSLDFGSAARVYWTLKSAGVGEIAILNGGVAGYAAAGHPLSTVEGANFPSDLAFSLARTWMIDADGVAAVQAGEADALMIDARPERFFTGAEKHELARIAGTLAGAVNLDHETWFGGRGGRLEVTPEAARAAAVEAGWAPGQAVVSFCNTGHWAATNWFVLSEIAGIEGVRLYPESLVGWTRSREELALR